MESLNARQCTEMLCACRDELSANATYLCRLDSFVGDGDHGLTVSDGFEYACAEILKRDCRTPYEVFNVFGKELGKRMGGAIGPIFQSFFLGMSSAIKEKELVDAADMKAMQNGALRSVMIIGGAKKGDCTLVDTLAPAAEAYSKVLSEGGDLARCMLAAEKAAEAGCSSTALLVAKKGRAKFLGEKSVGHQDAGATSMYLIYKAMAAYVTGS